MKYFYLKSAQGDIIALVYEDCNTVVRYKYDAWGKCTIVQDSSGVGIATVNPYRYRGYYYDTETGLYYLQSRYYDPETGRFVNADELLVMCHSVMNYNLFNYCYNDCVSYVDSFGFFGISTIIFAGIVALSPLLFTSCSNGDVSSDLPYSSADEAAIAFMNSTCSACFYIRHEFGTYIYSVTHNGKTTYNFAPPVSGNPHSVGYASVEVPKGAKIVATAHIHPNSNNFSGMAEGSKSGDIYNANSRGLDSYVVGPDLIIKKYIVSSQTYDNKVGNATPVELTKDEKQMLVSQFHDSWVEHLGKCGFGCEKMIWPTGGLNNENDGNGTGFGSGNLGISRVQYLLN